MDATSFPAEGTAPPSPAPRSQPPWSSGARAPITQASLRGEPRPGWTSALLDVDADWRGLAGRVATGAALSAVYGVALGAREGGSALLVHAIGVPAALLAVCTLGLPALFIVLALFDAPLSPIKAAGAAARGCTSAGLVLAGLAPLVALYVVGSDTAGGAALAGGLGLCLGGLLGLRHLVSTMREALARSDSATKLLAGAAQLAFALFAIVLAWRIWVALLPLIGGAS